MRKIRQCRLDEGTDEYEEDFLDYDFQVSTDMQKNTKFQLVGIRRDGKKEILKEFDKIPFSEMREFKAPDGSSGSLIKIGGAFVLGLLIGGMVVYLIMKSKEDGDDKKPEELKQPIQATVPIMSAIPDGNQWISEYDRDIFVRGD